MSDVTKTEIERLLQASTLAGNDATVALCRRAIAGDTAARAMCAAVIRYNRRKLEHALKCWKEKEHE